MQEIINRLDTLMKMCDRETSSAYEEIVYEVDTLILRILGKDSEEYRNFVRVFNEGNYESHKLRKLKGIIASVKNYITINRIKSENEISLKNINPNILKVVYKKFIDGYYSEAVESAIKEINSRLKKLYKKYKNEELDGSKLFPFVFNDDASKTLLFAGNLNDQSGKDEQEGFRFLLLGAWKGLRNPKAHENLDLDKNKAYESIVFASLLMNKIDECLQNQKLED